MSNDSTAQEQALYDALTVGDQATVAQLRADAQAADQAPPDPLPEGWRSPIEQFELDYQAAWARYQADHETSAEERLRAAQRAAWLEAGGTGMEITARVIVDPSKDPPGVRAQVTLDGVDLVAPTEIDEVDAWVGVMAAISQAAGTDLRPLLADAITPIVQQIQAAIDAEPHLQQRREHALEQWSQLVAQPGGS